MVIGGGGVKSLPFCLGIAYNVSSMEDIGTLGRYVDNQSIPLKIIFITVLKLRALAPLQIPASLYEGPIFYFYARVSSIPSHSNLLFSWQASCDGEISKHIGPFKYIRS